MKLKIFITGVLSFLVAITASNAQATKAAAFKLPAYQKFTLPNGLTVYLMEQHEVPVISFSAVLPAGAIYDGPQQGGLANLTADALKLGTQSYSKTQLEQELEFIGASLNTRAGKESANVSSKFASKDQDKVLAILAEVITKPTFNNDEFLKLQKRTLVQLDQARQSPRSVLSSYWDKFIFGEHVYGNPLSGTKGTVGKLTQADLKAFHVANYHASGSAIAVVGDFSAADMKTRLSKYFSGWERGNVASGKVSEAVVPPTKSRVLLVNKDDARETTFYIGSLGISRSNPDYVALQVVNTVFGGRFTSWLNDELRVNSGLTYGASSGFITQRNSGTFRISTFTKVSTTTQTIDLALKVLDSLQKKGFDERTLASAKNYVKGQFPPDYETSGQLSNLLTDMFWNGFDESYINNFENNVDGLTLAKAKEVINKYYPKDKLQFVLVGKASEIEPKLAKYGEVTKKEIKDDSF